MKYINYDIGDHIEVMGKEGVIFGFSQCMNHAVIELCKDKVRSKGHDGNMNYYWYDKSGEKVKYIKGYNYWYINIKDLEIESYEIY